jgi:hypothetical protein
VDDGTFVRSPQDEQEHAEAGQEDPQTAWLRRFDHDAAGRCWSDSASPRGRRWGDSASPRGRRWGDSASPRGRKKAVHIWRRIRGSNTAPTTVASTFISAAGTAVVSAGAAVASIHLRRRGRRSLRRGRRNLHLGLRQWDFPPAETPSFRARTRRPM